MSYGPADVAAAIADVVRAHEAAGTTYDLVLLGNDASDTGDFQVGIRLSYLLDRPVVTATPGSELTISWSPPCRVNQLLVFDPAPDRPVMCGFGPPHSGFRQLRIELGDQPLERFLVCRFGSGDQHVLRIGCSQQPPAVGAVDPGTVSGIDPRAVACQTLEHFVF